MSLTRLEEMCMTKEFRAYRKLLIQQAVDIIDIEDEKQFNDFRQGVMTLLRKVLNVPVNQASSKEQRDIFREHLAEDIKECRAAQVAKNLDSLT